MYKHKRCTKYVRMHVQQIRTILLVPQICINTKDARMCEYRCSKYEKYCHVGASNMNKHERCIKYVRIQVQQIRTIQVVQQICITRSSWLNCALRDDEAVYWVSIGHYEAVAVGNL